VKNPKIVMRVRIRSVKKIVLNTRDASIFLNLFCGEKFHGRRQGGRVGERIAQARALVSHATSGQEIAATTDAIRPVMV
jgi:hypothetical protein